MTEPAQDPIRDGQKHGGAARRLIRWMLNLLGFVLGGFLLFALFVPGGHPPEAGHRSQCRNNLKQIGLALHNYHDAFGCFPPAYVADENGRPMHSWRMLILPYFEHSPVDGEARFDRETFDQYHFEEPWDGLHNRRLHESIQRIFNCPSETSKLTSKCSANTNYLAVIGSETLWPGTKSVIREKLSDGASNTLMIVETANSGIHWMEPRDLHVVQMARRINSPNGMGMSSRHSVGATGLLADGRVHFFDEKLPATTLRALLTINSKEPLADNDF